MNFDNRRPTPQPSATLLEPDLPPPPRVRPAPAPAPAVRPAPAINEAESKPKVRPCPKLEDDAKPSVDEILEERRFWRHKVPAPVRAVYTLAGRTVCTPGNLATITANVKAGKSSVVCAMLASVMGGSGGDYLGFASSNPGGLAVLHFDSEQAPDDHWRMLDKAMVRAGLEEQPVWLYSYCLTGLDYQTAWDCVCKAIRSAAKRHGGIHSILLDGVADLVCNVNDPEECNRFVAQLHGLAIGYDCPILCVIHFNPNSEKTRGHLGSQLERKAETNLQLTKADGVTVIWSDKQRGPPVSKEHGPRFEWSAEKQMHVSGTTLSALKEGAEMENLQALMREALGDAKMTFSALKVSAKRIWQSSERTVARRIQRSVKLGLISKDAAGKYRLRGEKE